MGKLRNELESVCWMALLLEGYLTWEALSGPHRLPEKIAVHFDHLGQPNGWGSSGSLLVMPLMALFIYVVMTGAGVVVARNPELISCPVPITDENRDRIQALTQRLLLWIKTEIVCLFGWVLWVMIQGARGQMVAYSTFNRVTLSLIALFFVTIGGHIVAMYRAR